MGLQHARKSLKNGVEQYIIDVLDTLLSGGQESHSRVGGSSAARSAPTKTSREARYCFKESVRMLLLEFEIVIKTTLGKLL